MINEYFTAWLALTAINIAAVISPGPAFVVTIRHALGYNRKVGLILSLGLGLGIAVHVLIVMSGLAFIMMQSAWVFNAIKYLGAAYLIFIGSKAILTRKKLVRTDIGENFAKDVQGQDMSAVKAFLTGFMANLLNPKAIIFFAAIFTQFIDLTTPTHILTIYGLTAVFLETIWFAFVTIVLTNPRIKVLFMGAVHWFERICGGFMIGLGVKLALSKV